MSETKPAAPQLSVVLITLNEEARLAYCLRSLPRECEIVVLDSSSTDRTVSIAREHGARVETRDFDDFARQKNAAMALATRPWVLSLDADEVLTPELRLALAEVTNANNKAAAFRLTRRLVFQGRHLRFGKAVDHPIRLIRRGTGQFVSAIHERLEIHGTVDALAGDLLHYSYSDLTDYFNRFNRYTSRVAENHYALGHTMPLGLKHWLRPWTEFFYRYILRLGFLDGYPGYTYALVSSMYTYIKYAKLRELLIRKSSP
ncbi:MAG: glycosyltransferase family 2 protein [Deltaproteobacteria bacterium]|nr:glycosyltransferase family 2 protein [Deltaproteobacteria bacterium]